MNDIADDNGPDLAIQIASQVWCVEETSHIEMDVVLATEFAKRLRTWINCCQEQQRNTDFYTGLLDECATHLGPDVYVSDDGSVQDSPLRIKVPEMVAAQAKRIAGLESDNAKMQQSLSDWLAWSMSKGPGLEAYREQQLRIADLEAALKVIRDSPYRPVEDCASVARTALEKKP